MTEEYIRGRAYCEQAFASFRLGSKELDPADVTRELGITPTKTHKAGKEKVEGRRRPVPLIWGSSHWSLSTKDRIESQEIGEHIEWLLEQLEPVGDKVLKFASRSDTHADIFVFCSTFSSHGGPELRASILKRLGILGIDLNFDIYFSE